MKAIARFFIFSFVFLIFLFISVLFFPGFYINQAIGLFIYFNNIENFSYRVKEADIDNAIIHKLEIGKFGELSIDKIKIQYSLKELFSGKINKIDKGLS